MVCGPRFVMIWEGCLTSRGPAEAGSPLLLLRRALCWRPGSQPPVLPVYFVLEYSRLRNEDEMVGWHHRLNEHEFGPTPGDSEGQGGLTHCDPSSRKESATT